MSLFLGAWLAALGSISVLVLGHQIWWTNQVRAQLEVDRCLATYTLRLERWLNHVETNNQRIQKTRAAILLAPQPQTLAALRLALSALDLDQSRVAALWKAQEIRWYAVGCCSGANPAGKSSFPIFPWTRLPPDAVGPQAWKKIALPSLGVFLRAEKKSRSSAARIVQDSGSERWRAQWALREQRAIPD